MFDDQPQTFKPQKATQRLARMVGVSPDAGRHCYVCPNPGRLDSSALTNGIMIVDLFTTKGREGHEEDSQNFLNLF
jgi:hypothetical protein